MVLHIPEITTFLRTLSDSRLLIVEELYEYSMSEFGIQGFALAVDSSPYGTPAAGWINYSLSVTFFF